MPYNLNVARQFHSLLGDELASQTPTCVDINVWRGAEVHAKDSAPFLTSTWTPTHGVELDAMHVRGV